MKLKEKMKNKNHNKFDKKKLIGTISKKHIKNGSYTMVMSVIFTRKIRRPYGQRKIQL